MKPLISIIMNCFNGERYLENSIESILKQTYSNWELIFWDNQSIDGSSEIVNSYQDKRIRYFLASKHTKLGVARSQALKESKGELIAFLDVDDIWFANKLEEVLKCYLKHENAAFFYSNTIFFNQETSTPLYNRVRESGPITSLLLTNYFLSFESVVINRKILDGLEIKFDMRFDFITDFDLFTRLSTISDAIYMPKILCGWRVHNQSGSFKKTYLFHQEKLLWYSININNKLFKSFKNELNEFKLITNAEKSFYSNNPLLITRIDKVFFQRFSNLKNFLKYLLSALPLGKYFYKLKRFKKLKKL